MAGRPTKLTREIHDRIVTAIRAGNYIETAAAHAGIHKDTLYHWLKRGREASSGPYRAFSDAVQKAWADAEIRDVTLIAKAAEKEWTAAAWRLERKFPDRWGRKDRHEVSGPNGQPIRVSADLTRLSDKELASLEQILRIIYDPDTG